MFIFLCTAKYIKDDDYRQQGSRYPLIAFAEDAEYDNALIAVESYLEESGWIELELRKIKQNNSGDPGSTDPIMVGAYNDAKSNGISLVVYTNEIT